MTNDRKYDWEEEMEEIAPDLFDGMEAEEECIENWEDRLKNHREEDRDRRPRPELEIEYDVCLTTGEHVISTYMNQEIDSLRPSFNEAVIRITEYDYETNQEQVYELDRKFENWEDLVKTLERGNERLIADFQKNKEKNWKLAEYEFEPEESHEIERESRGEVLR